MSRIGRKVHKIPAGVNVDFTSGIFKAKGPLGELSFTIRPEITINIENGDVVCSVSKQTKLASAYWGLTSALVGNILKGVSEGFEKKLELVGVGYRVKPNGSDITLTVGFSHPVEVKAPEGIKFEVPDNTNLTIKGVDKQLVGQTASNIRKIRKPEPYKGKGIKYANEIVRRKAGKSAKAK